MRFKNRKDLIEFLLKFNPTSQERIKIGHGSILTYDEHVRDAELFVTRHLRKNHLMIIAVNNRGYEKTTLPESEFYPPTETFFESLK